MSLTDAIFRFLLVICFYSVGLAVCDSAVISGFGCLQGNTTYFTPGGSDTVEISCFVNNTGPGNLNILQWTLSKNGATLGTFAVSSASQPQTTSGFTAYVVSSNDTERIITSNLTFIPNPSQDDVIITCANLLVITVSCRVLVYTVPSIVTNLIVTGVTYENVSLSWTAPTDTGRYPTVNYIITVTPLNGSNSWTITTDDSTSYIVTGLMFRQSYNFTVRANNSIGQGEPSNTVSELLPGEEPPSIVADVCVIKSFFTNTLAINWTFPIISNIDETPPITSYNVANYGTELCSVPPDVTQCDNITVADSKTYVINVIAVNRVGDSDPFDIAGTTNFSYLTATANSSNDSTILLCITTYTSEMDRVCKITINGISNTLLDTFTGNTATITISGLAPGTTYTYTASLVDSYGLTFDDACIRVNGDFTTLVDDTSPSASTVPTTTTSIKTPSGTSILVPVKTEIVIDPGIAAVTCISLVIITAIISSLLSSLITYCCVKSKGSHSVSTVAVPYETPVATELEMKDNMAYGQVGNARTTPAVYDTVYM